MAVYTRHGQRITSEAARIDESYYAEWIKKEIQRSTEPRNSCNGNKIKSGTLAVREQQLLYLPACPEKGSVNLNDL
jgi:hypothetical protein